MGSYDNMLRADKRNRAWYDTASWRERYTKLKLRNLALGYEWTHVSYGSEAHIETLMKVRV